MIGKFLLLFSHRNPPTGLQRPDGRLPEVHGGVEGGGGLGLLLLEVATGANIPCRYLHLAVPPVQIFILTLMYLLVPAFAIYMQTISNKYYVLTYHMFYSI